jgi:multicomponent K+:H+ antiporter subunit A
VPLLNGFLSKEMFFAETVVKETHAAMQWLLPAGATLAGVFGVAYSLRFIHDTFFNGEPVGLPRTPHEPPFFMRAPVLLLVLLCAAVGLAPAQTAGPVLAVAAQSALGAPLPPYTLAIWHGVNPALVMSLAAVAGGMLLYVGLQRFVDLHRLVHLPLWLKTGGREVFVVLLDGGLAAAAALTSALQNGRLQVYLTLLLAMALAAGAWPFLAAGGPAPNAMPLHFEDLGFAFGTIVGIGIVATVGTVAARRSRLLALVSMGAVGLVVCLIFVWLSAPDLALTQLLVEVATILLMMLALHWLPGESPAERGGPERWGRPLHAAIALAVGCGIAALVWLVATRPSDSISTLFLERALPDGGGANVVNVVIVDFRGFDTLGEITVMAIAALIVHALLSDFAPRVSRLPGPECESHPLMLQLAARIVLPFALLVSVHLFLRGHNLPGGGFIAGLVLAIALLLMHVAHGAGWAAQRMAGDLRPMAGWGLLIALITGVASAWFGAPFLTSTYDLPWLPGIGGVPLASASAFDLGVYLVVTGATMVMLLSIARLSRGGRR